MSDAREPPAPGRPDHHDQRARLAETRKLVKLALDDGWTEAEIARRCRVDADKVAAWKNGKARGRRHELQPLLDAFGWRLRRQKARVYLVVDPEAAPKWDDTDEGRRLLAQVAELRALQSEHADLLKAIDAVRGYGALEELKAHAAAKMEEWTHALDEMSQAPATRKRPHDKRDRGRMIMEPGVVTVRTDPKEAGRSSLQAWIEAAQRILQMTDVEETGLKRLAELRGALPHQFDEAIQVARAHFDETRSIRAALVGGRVVFSYLFTRPAHSIGRDPRLRREPIARWVVHHLGTDHFILVQQRRRTLSPPRAEQWRESLRNINWQGNGLHEVATITPELVDAHDDAARWIATIDPPTTLRALLDRIDALMHQPDPLHGPNDEVSLPFLLRKALIEQGFDVPGVVFHGID